MRYIALVDGKVGAHGVVVPDLAERVSPCAFAASSMASRRPASSDKFARVDQHRAVCDWPPHKGRAIAIPADRTSRAEPQRRSGRS